MTEPGLQTEIAPSEHQGWSPSEWVRNDLREIPLEYHRLLCPYIREGASIVLLNCHFDAGGPWAGVSQFFRQLVPGMLERAKPLMQRHAFELIHILPYLRYTVTVSNPTLTDLAKDEEKVRNYAADRAYRIVHGLIELLDEYSTLAPRSGATVLVCEQFHQAGNICRKFFTELARRRASKLNLRLVIGTLAVERPAIQGLFVDKRFVEFCETADSVLPSSMLSNEEALRRAKALEQSVGKDRTAIQPQIPDLIALWRAANDPERVLRWRLYATAFYCNLGLYADALRYADGLLEYAAAKVQGSEVIQWWVANKLLNAFTALGKAEEGLELAEGEAARLVKWVDPIWRGQLFYLTAMLYARYSKPRDYVRGEEYLDRGMEMIAMSEIQDEGKYFNQVFNRNGLAMIRTFQGRHEEAIALCRQGIESLDAHLEKDRHRLHRSILHYNVAQVYAATERYEDAIRWYGAAMEMDPNYSEYYNERGNIFFKLGRLVEARKDYQRAIELSPPYYEVLTNLGQCERALGYFDTAIDSYNRALDLQPDHTLALIGRAKSLEELGKVDDAILDYTAAIEHGEQQWEVFANRGVMRYQSGDLAGCISDLSEAIRLNPGNPDLLRNRSLAYNEARDLGCAIADLDRALTLDITVEDRRSIEVELSRLRASEPAQAGHALNDVVLDTEASPLPVG